MHEAAHSESRLCESFMFVGWKQKHIGSSLTQTGLDSRPSPEDRHHCTAWTQQSTSQDWPEITFSQRENSSKNSATSKPRHGFHFLFIYFSNIVSVSRFTFLFVGAEKSSRCGLIYEKSESRIQGVNRSCGHLDVSRRDVKRH